MNEQPNFGTIDIFLCHHSQDHFLVRRIAEALKQRSLSPWMDRNDIPAGAPFQRRIGQAILETKSAAIFFGLNGVGKWQRDEIDALHVQSKQRNLILIPVLLPGVNQIPSEFVFLQGRHWLRLESQAIDEEFLIALERGIKSQPFDRDPNPRQGVYRSAPRVNWSIILGIVGLLVILIVAFKFFQGATSQPRQPVQSTPTSQPTRTCKDYDTIGKYCHNRSNDCRDCSATP